MKGNAALVCSSMQSTSPVWSHSPLQNCLFFLPVSPKPSFTGIGFPSGPLLDTVVYLDSLLDEVHFCYPRPRGRRPCLTHRPASGRDRPHLARGSATTKLLP